MIKTLRQVSWPSFNLFANGNNCAVTFGCSSVQVEIVFVAYCRRCATMYWGRRPRLELSMSMPRRTRNGVKTDVCAPSFGENIQVGAGAPSLVGTRYRC